jgi:hypothetical protein
MLRVSHLPGTAQQPTKLSAASCGWCTKTCKQAEGRTSLPSTSPSVLPCVVATHMTPRRDMVCTERASRGSATSSMTTACLQNKQAGTHQVQHGVRQQTVPDT